MKKIISLVVALCALTSLHGGDAEKSVKAVAPFLDDQTFAIVRIDVAGADIDAAFRKLTTLLGTGKAADGQELQMIKQWRGKILDAGAKEAYIVWSMADPLGMPFGVIPAGGEQMARALAGTIRTSFPMIVDSEAVGTSVLVGRQDVLKRLTDVKPAAFPELAKAFAAAGEGTVQAVVVPPPPLRRAVSEVIPKLPKQFGNVPISVLDRGIVWVAASVSITPKMSIRYVIQSRDDDAANDLAKVADRFIQGLATSSDAKEMLPDWIKVFPQLIPKAEGSRLVLALDDEAINKLLVPAVQKVREAAARTQSMNNLKQIGLAMHNYADVYKSFPAYANFDKNGQPLLSWRVHILPFVEGQELYKQFHLDEPWDSAHNKELIARIPPIYRSPLSKAGDGKTTYLLPVGKKAMFGGKKGLSIRDITDGTSNTIMVVEANDDNAIIWSKPGDYNVDVKDLLKGLLQPRARMFNVGMADGSVRSVSKTVTLQTLRAAFTRNGGEVLGRDW